MMLKPNAGRAIAEKRKGLLPPPFHLQTSPLIKQLAKSTKLTTMQRSSANQHPVWLTPWKLGSTVGNLNSVFGVHTKVHLSIQSLCLHSPRQV